jgi:hypothetical protein
MSEETTEHTHDHAHSAPDPSALPEGVKFKAGFAVLIGEDGAVFIEKDLAQFNVPVDRESTLLEIRRYTSEILMDLQAQAAAEYTSLRIAAEKTAAPQA